MRRWAPLLMVVVGAAATVVVAWRLDMPADDVAELLVLATGGAGAAALIGVFVLAILRRSSIATQAVAVALVAVTGTAVGVGLAADAMFVSSHDVGALVVVLLASSTVAVACALGFGARLGTASGQVVELARRLGAGDRVDVADRPASSELATLADELAVASARLDDARRRERAMDDARRMLVAGVSHDLRTPLAGIRAMVEAIQDGVVERPEEVDSYLRSIGDETDRLTALVEDLFELSRIEAGAFVPRREPVAFGDLVEEAVAAVMPAATLRGVDVSGHGSAGGPDVLVDPVGVVRVARNLLDNAISHTAAGGNVTVSWQVAEGSASLSVRDECGGIPEDDLPRLFEPAFRGDAARTRDGHRGGGLGLAIARGIVEAHGGDVRVANEEGGCRFDVDIPTERTDQSAPHPITKR